MLGPPSRLWPEAIAPPNDRALIESGTLVQVYLKGLGFKEGGGKAAAGVLQGVPPREHLYHWGRGRIGKNEPTTCLAERGTRRRALTRRNDGNAPQRRATPGPTSIGAGKGGAEPSAGIRTTLAAG